MARKPDAYLIDDENPEWTEEDFARARPAAEVLPRELYEKLVGTQKRRRASATVPVTLRLDREVVDAFKAEGAGWRTRIADTLKRVVARRRRSNA